MFKFKEWLNADNRAAQFAVTPARRILSAESDMYESTARCRHVCDVVVVGRFTEA